MQLSPQSSPIPLVFLRYKFNSEILTCSVPPEWGVKHGWGGETSYEYFLALRVDISKTVRDTTKVRPTTNDK